MKFWAKVTLLAVFILILSAGMIFYTSYKVVSIALFLQMADRFENNASTLMLDIDRFFFMRQSDIQIIRDSFIFKRDVLNLKDLTERLGDFRDTYKCYVSLSYYDLNGNKLADTSGLGIGMNEGDRIFFKQAVKNGLSPAEEVDISTSQGIPVIFFSALVNDLNNIPIGVVVSRVPLYKLKEIVSGSHLADIKGSYVDILDEEGKLIFTTRKWLNLLEKSLSRDNLNNIIPKDQKTGFLKTLYDNKADAPAKDIRRNEYFKAFAVEPGYLDYKGNNWIGIVYIPEREVYAPINKVQGQMLVLFVLCVLITLAAAIFLSRKISKPLVKLSEAAEEIGKGNLDVKIAYYSTDEVGQLADSFRDMAGGLKESRKKLEQYSLELESKVKERTSALESTMADLKDTQEATLSALEDTNEAKEELERSNAELRRVKLELENFSKEMESLVESMVEGVIMLDEPGEVVVFNPQAKKMLGFEPNKEITSGILKEKLNTYGLDKSIEECRMKKVLVTKEIDVSQAGLTLHADISPVKNVNNEIIGVVTILRDITKEKEVDRMKTEFVSTVSHELRTPLTTMKEFTSIILDEIPGKLTEDQKEYMGIIRGNIERLARLINDLLDISKIEAGKVELKKTVVDIVDLAESTASTFNVLAKDRHIELVMLLPPARIGIYADPDKIVQVFTNLIGNALNFTPADGKVTISVLDKGNEVECSVSDTGPGIAKENMDKLFGKFQQFNRVAGDGAKGTGLGLAISKGLVEMHNGRIWAKSEEGKGTTFVFTFSKYTDEMPLKEYVDNGIKEAARKNSGLSLIIISVTGKAKSDEGLSEKEKDLITRGIEDTIKKCLRPSDFAVKYIGHLIAVLVDCGKEGCLTVQGRLNKAMEDYLKNSVLSEKVKVYYGYASYPEDAKNSEGLIKKVKKGMSLE